MDPLYKQAISKTLSGALFFAALVFVPAGTLEYWQGWLFFAVITVSIIAFTVYLALYDKPLLERRMKVGPQYEKELSQKMIISLIYLAFLAFIVLPALDFRFGLSPVPSWVSLVGDALIMFSFLSIFWVIRTNSWAASNISVASDQRVIDTGPYAYVRHPMYAGALWLFVGMPLALGSWYSIFLIVPFFPVLMWRLLDEERILERDLPGYIAYGTKVRSRLIPYIW